MTGGHDIAAGRESGRRFPGLARILLHDAVLDATARLVVDGGWQATRMADVAAAVGISRQTLYTDFGSKHALMQALVARETCRLMEELAGVLATQPNDARSALRAGAAFLLRRSRADALVKTMLTAPAGDDLLPLITTDAGPILMRTATAFAAYFTRFWPDADPAGVALVGDALTRLLITHVVLPDKAEQPTADAITDLLDPFLAELTRSRT